jgi:acetyltransferase-like isoleucine patch superfamily enzyme
MDPYIHPSAIVSPDATIGEGTRIWHQAHIRERARLGRECIVGKGAYIDFDVVIGDRCKLQNGVYVYHGVTMDDGVFVGPGVMLLNDKNPRAINPDGSLKVEADWNVCPIHIGHGAAIGAGVIVSPGVSVGKWASVGAGSVVTRNVRDYALAYGNPARVAGFVCPCGQRFNMDAGGEEVVDEVCGRCGLTVPPELRPRPAEETLDDVRILRPNLSPAPAPTTKT